MILGIKGLSFFNSILFISVDNKEAMISLNSPFVLKNVFVFYICFVVLYLPLGSYLGFVWLRWAGRGRWGGMWAGRNILPYITCITLGPKGRLQAD